MSAASSAVQESASGLVVTRVGPYLRDFETRFDLLRHRFDGWSVWPLFRIAAARSLTETAARPPTPVEGPRRLNVARLAFLDLLALARAPHSVAAAVMTCSSYRVELENGRWKDVMFDDFVRGIDSAFRLERINNPRIFERGNALFPSQMTTSWMELAARSILSRLPVPVTAVTTARDLVADLRAEPAFAGFTVETVARRLALFRQCRRVWASFFRRIGARVVLCDDGYFQHDLIAGARSAGTVVCELQHGVLLEDGAEYCWPAAAIEHRDRMPIPDRFLLFGNEWSKLLSKDGFWTHTARVIGSARIDAYRKRAAAYRRAADPDRCMVVITTQGFSREKVAQFLHELLHLAKAWDGLRVTLKLHPAYDTDSEPYRRAIGADPRATIVAAHEDPSTFELLAQADFHASISSACHYDALGLGVKTIIIAMPTHEMMLPLHRRGHALMAATPAEMLEQMREHHGRRLPEEVGHAYFEPEAVRNFEREFAEVHAEPPRPWS